MAVYHLKQELLDIANPLTGIAAKTYQELEAKSLPLIEAYHNDLIVHDRDTLAEYPGIPFLHFTGDTGTYMIMMLPCDHAGWPEENAKVPYLFGYADRWHILKGLGEYVDGMKRLNRQALILHFNGKTFREIAQSDAEYIIEEYIRSITHSWTHKNERNERKAA
jgi:hypothetical protein